MKPRKVEIKQVQEVLVEKGIDDNIIQDVVSSLSHSDDVDDGPNEPKNPKQFFIVISDPNGELPDKDFVGWVGQLSEEEAVHTAMDKIHRAGYEFNTTRKGRKCPVETVGEIMECVSPKICKENGFWIKTKEPVLIIKTDNKLPMEKVE